MHVTELIAEGMIDLGNVTTGVSVLGGTAILAMILSRRLVLPREADDLRKQLDYERLQAKQAVDDEKKRTELAAAKADKWQQMAFDLMADTRRTLSTTERVVQKVEGVVGSASQP